MIDSVAGAIVSAMPAAMSIMRQAHVGPVVLSTRELSTADTRPTSRAQSPARDDDLRAEAVARAAALSGDTIIISAAHGRKRTPVSSGE